MSSYDKYVKGKELYKQGNIKKAEKLLTKAAEDNLKEAQVLLGILYSEEHELSRSDSDKLAFSWFEKAARKGDPEAMYRLGCCYKSGHGVEKDEAKAAEWFEKAALQGYQEANDKLISVLYHIILLAENKEDEDLDYVYWEKKITYWFEKAAECGDEIIQVKLGECYENGWIVEEDLQKAAYWYEEATMMDDDVEISMRLAEIYKNPNIIKGINMDLKSQHELGLKYQKRKDYDNAVYWFLKAAEAEYPEAQYEMGCCCRNGYGVAKDEKEAFFWFEKAAQGESSNGQVELGICYANGQGVNKDDKKAVYWYEKAAQQGNAFGQNILGIRYETGKGVEKDEGKAVYWYEKAALQGHAGSQNSLGIMYENGKGVDEDKAKAAYWYRKSAIQNNKFGQFNLGRAYLNGEGIEQDYEKAAFWFEWSWRFGYDATFKLADAWVRRDEKIAEAKEDYDLSDKYLQGDGVEKDQKKTEEYFVLSAKKGYIEAQYELGCELEEQAAENQDAEVAARTYKEAAFWFEKAAKQGEKDVTTEIHRMEPYKEELKKGKTLHLGHVSAQKKLANLYFEGKGVEKDVVKAGYWLHRATMQGDREAEEILKKVRSELWLLNEKVVSTIYEDCIVDEENQVDEYYPYITVEVLGKDLTENSTGKVVFSEVKIADYSMLIKVMFGLLFSFHRLAVNQLLFEEGYIDYRGTRWTEDRKVLLKLYALGIANEVISSFYKLYDGTLAAKKCLSFMPAYYPDTSDFAHRLETIKKVALIGKSYSDTKKVIEIIENKSTEKKDLMQGIKLLHRKLWEMVPDDRERVTERTKKLIRESKYLTKAERMKSLTLLELLKTEIEMQDMLYDYTSVVSEESLKERIKNRFEDLSEENQNELSSLPEKGFSLSDIYHEAVCLGNEELAEKITQYTWKACNYKE